MQGPLFLHHRIQPLFDALTEAGFSVVCTSRRDLNSSSDSFRFNGGSSSLTVQCADGVAIVISETSWTYDDESRFEIHNNPLLGAFLPDQWCDHDYDYWTFYPNDFPTLIDALERFAQEHGGK